MGCGFRLRGYSTARRLRCASTVRPSGVGIRSSGESSRLAPCAPRVGRACGSSGSPRRRLWPLPGRHHPSRSPARLAGSAARSVLRHRLSFAVAPPRPPSERPADGPVGAARRARAAGPAPPRLGRRRRHRRLGTRVGGPPACGRSRRRRRGGNGDRTPSPGDALRPARTTAWPVVHHRSPRLGPGRCDDPL